MPRPADPGVGAARARLRVLAVRYRLPLLAGAVAGCALAGLAWANLQCLRWLCDEHVYRGPWGPFGRALGALFAVALASALLNWVQAAVNGRVLVSMNRDLIADGYAAIRRRPLPFFHAHPPGELLTLLLLDAPQATTLIPLGRVDLTRHALTLAVLLAFLSAGSWQILIPCAVLGLGLPLIATGVSRRIERRLAAAQRTREALTGGLLGHFAAAPLLAIHDPAGHEGGKIAALNTRLAGENRRLMLIEQAGRSLMEALVLAVMCAFLIAGYHLVQRGLVAPGHFVSMLVACYLVNGSVRSLVDVYARIRQARVHLDRLAVVFEGDDHAPIRARRPAPDARIVEIALEALDFGYGPAAVLRNASARFETGRLTGVTGTSGSGKTTLLSLLAGLLVPARGIIRVNEAPLDTLDPKSWLGRIAYLPQNIPLLDGTIADNIALGDPAPDRGRVVRAAMAARIDGFIAALPHGYDTPVGAGLPGISEGEKRRIEIARALYRDAPVILLDEPTASLDAENRAAIIEAIRALRDRLVVVATHDPAVLAACDRVWSINAAGGLDPAPSGLTHAAPGVR